MGEGDIKVQPADLKKAGGNAEEIAEQTYSPHNSNLRTSAQEVSRDLSGFTLAEAHAGCVGKWEEELDALAFNIREAGEAWRTNADNYDKADAAGQRGFDSLGSMLGD